MLKNKILLDCWFMVHNEITLGQEYLGLHRIIKEHKAWNIGLILNNKRALCLKYWPYAVL